MLNKWSWLTFRSSKTVSIYDHFIKPLLSSIQHVKDSLKWNHYSDIGALLLIDSYPTDLRRFRSLLCLPGMCEERWWLFRIKWCARWRWGSDALRLAQNNKQVHAYKPQGVKSRLVWIRRPVSLGAPPRLSSFPRYYPSQFMIAKKYKYKLVGLT